MHTSAGKIRAGLYLVVLALVMLTALSAMNMVDENRYGPRGKNIGSLLKQTKMAKKGRVSLDDYKAIRPDRFCGRPTVSGPVRRKGGAAKETVFVLRGTAIHTDPARSYAFIEVPGADGQHACRVGEEVHGARLMLIERDFVEIEYLGKTVTVEVTEEEEPRGSRDAEADDAEKWARKLPPEVKRRIMESMSPGERRKWKRMSPNEKRKLIKEFRKRFEGGGKDKQRDRGNK
jgi:type II secretory pathway component PulC